MHARGTLFLAIAIISLAVALEQIFLPIVLENSNGSDPVTRSPTTAPTPISTQTATATGTLTSVTGTPTGTATSTATSAQAATSTPTGTPTNTPTNTSTSTPTPTSTDVSTTTPTPTPTATTPASGAAEDVQVRSNFFSPGTVTISRGEKVRWENEGGFHNVVADDNSFSNGPASFNAWTFEFTFATPGTYPYHCQIHGGSGGFGMSGTVIVE